MTGTLTDTYVAALQHDLVDLPPGTSTVGVVRQPTHWFHAAVDENRPELGPPESLLADVRDRADAFAVDGLCEAEAHNAAFEAVDFAERYREYVETDPAATAAVEELHEAVDSGGDVALVCYENTDQKRCHRTILRDVIVAALD